MKAADTPTFPVPSALKSRRVNTRTAHPVSGKAPRLKLAANSNAIVPNGIKSALLFSTSNHYDGNSVTFSVFRYINKTALALKIM
jgi:hypothetical protein